MVFGVWEGVGEGGRFFRTSLLLEQRPPVLLGTAVPICARILAGLGFEGGWLDTTPTKNSRQGDHLHPGFADHLNSDPQ